MEYRQLGSSGLRVPVMCYGTATFGGGDDFFKAWGNADVEDAKRIIDVSMDSGLNFFDTANVYSRGASEEILGKAIKGIRSRTLISTKSTFTMGDGPNDYGSNRLHILEQCEQSLKRLQTDYIDIYHMHGMDMNTPVEETLRALDDLVKSGKVRYIACSNYSAWHLMKSLSASDREGLSRYVGHQIYYSLVGRESENELIPLGLDQGVGTIVWSPLAGGALTGKIRRDKPAPKDSRLGQIKFVPYEDEILFKVVDVLDQIAKERQKTITQVALNWILRRPSTSTIVVGARNAEQLTQNLGALGWSLTESEMVRLNEASSTAPLYPYWHQRGSPKLVKPLPLISQ